MFFLVDFPPMNPDFGLFFWTVLIFGIFFFLLSKFAFKPIAQGLKEREQSIANALASADKARAEMANLQSQNEALLKQAQEERSLMLKEAKETKDRIIAEAKEQAKADAQKIMINAMTEIDNIKNAAIVEVKNQAGLLALDIAEKVIRKELKSNAAQQSFVNDLVKQANLN